MYEGGRGQRVGGGSSSGGCRGIDHVIDLDKVFRPAKQLGYHLFVCFRLDGFGR